MHSHGKAWQHTPLGESESLAILGDVYRFCAIYNAVHMQTLKTVVAHLRSKQIEPILVKGWSIGRLYSESARRPFGDIDLCVRPDHYPEADRLLKDFRQSIAS